MDSSNPSYANYSNNTLTFTLPPLRIGDEFYVTFDAGVLYSNSPAQNDSNFLHFKVIDLQTSTVSDYTSMGTSQYTSVAISMSYNNTSAVTATTAVTTQMTSDSTIGTFNTSSYVMNTGRKKQNKRRICFFY